MEATRYKPLVDRLFFMIFVPTFALTLSCAIIPAIFSPTTLIITVPVFLFTTYFLVSPLFGYVELREDGLLIKYGFFLKRYIPYERVRALEKQRKFYSESMMSLKLAYEQVNIKYNVFDVTTVSVKDNDGFIKALTLAKEERLKSI